MQRKRLVQDVVLAQDAPVGTRELILGQQRVAHRVPASANAHGGGRVAAARTALGQAHVHPRLALAQHPQNRQEERRLVGAHPVDDEEGDAPVGKLQQPLALHGHLHPSNPSALEHDSLLVRPRRLPLERMVLLELTLAQRGVRGGLAPQRRAERQVVQRRARLGLGMQAVQLNEGRRPVVQPHVEEHVEESTHRRTRHLLVMRHERPAAAQLAVAVRDRVGGREAGEGPCGAGGGAAGGARLGAVRLAQLTVAQVPSQ